MQGGTGVSLMYSWLEILRSLAIWCQWLKRCISKWENVAPGFIFWSEKSRSCENCGTASQILKKLASLVSVSYRTPLLLGDSTCSFGRAILPVPLHASLGQCDLIVGPRNYEQKWHASFSGGSLECQCVPHLVLFLSPWTQGSAVQLLYQLRSQYEDGSENTGAELLVDPGWMHSMSEK